MKFKTTEDLKLEWGQRRFVEALGYLYNITINKGFTGKVGELQDLYDNHNDVFEVYKALTIEQADKFIRNSNGTVEKL